MRLTIDDEPMSDVDAVVWAVEREPRFRTTIAALARLDGRVDHAALRHRVDRATRVVPRLRQRVAADPLGIAPPWWTFDPDFRLAFHLRTTRLGAGGTDRDLLELVRDLVVQPFDRSRPLWEITVIDGLHDGTSAVLLKTHHAVSDGIGGVRLMSELFDLEPTPDPNLDELPPAPVAGRVTPPGRPTRDEVRHTLQTGLGWLERMVTTDAGDMLETAGRLGRTMASASRLFRPEPAPRSPLMRRRSEGLHLDSLSFDLDDLRAAGARVGGTINDAFVAAVALGVADHHRHAGVELAGLRVSIPVNTRSGDDSLGNHWTPGRIDLPLFSLTDAGPDPLTALVGRQIRRMRAEPGHALLGPVAGLMRRLPPPATAGAFAMMAGGIDVAASNVPGSPVPLHLCGASVRSLVPFGPLSGAAANITLMSHAATADIGITTDPAAVADPEGFRRHLAAAFAAVAKGS